MIPFQNIVILHSDQRCDARVCILRARFENHTKHTADAVEAQTFRGIPMQRLIAFVRLERNVVCV